MSDPPLLERFEALTALILELRPLWAQKAFAFRSLPWERHRPELARSLRALNPEQVVALHRGAERPAPSSPLGQIEARASALTVLPSAPGQPRRLSGRLAWRIGGRKLRQIEAFSAAVEAIRAPASPELLEWCSGKGALARVMSARHGLKARCLERDARLCESGAELARRARARCHFHVVDVLQQPTSAHVEGADTALALHACGALTDRLIERSAAAETPAIFIAPCCFHMLGGAPRFRALSRAGRDSGLRPSGEALRLAHADQSVAVSRVRARRDHELRFRLALDLLAREGSGVDRFSRIGPLPTRTLRLPFDVFAREVARSRGLRLPPSWDAEAALRAGAERLREVRAMSLARAQLRRPLELWWALDRALALEEAGYAVRLFRFCARDVTPRNLLIAAVRAGSSHRPRERPGGTAQPSPLRQAETQSPGWSDPESVVQPPACAPGAPREDEMDRLPVTLISGFLGAGKTTLLRHLLSAREGDPRVAVIVNDVADLNIDAELIREATDTVVELSGGCTCCSLQEDLLGQVRALAEAGRYDHLLIESTGVAEPLPVARLFLLPPSEARSLSGCAELRAAVTVVDAAQLLEALPEEVTLAEVEGVSHEGDSRALSTLLVEQLEFADRVILNKTDLASEAQLEAVSRLVTRLNPRAAQLRCAFGEVDAAALLESEQQTRRPGWLAALERPAAEPAFSTRVYRRWRPFHPERLARALEEEGLPGIVRSKGFVWSATKASAIGLWSQAGRAFTLTPAGRWWVTREREDWPDDAALIGRVEARWREPYGDRRQEIAFIGEEGVDFEAVFTALDACLLSDEEMSHGLLGWRYLPDPWPDLSLALWLPRG